MYRPYKLNEQEAIIYANYKNLDTQKDTEELIKEVSEKALSTLDFGNLKWELDWDVLYEEELEDYVLDHDQDILSGNALFWQVNEIYKQFGCENGIIKKLESIIDPYIIDESYDSDYIRLADYIKTKHTNITLRIFTDYIRANIGNYDIKFQLTKSHRYLIQEYESRVPFMKKGDHLNKIISITFTRFRYIHIISKQGDLFTGTTIYFEDQIKKYVEETYSTHSKNILGLESFYSLLIDKNIPHKTNIDLFTFYSFPLFDKFDSLYSYVGL